MTSIGEFCRCGHWKFDHDKLFGCKKCLEHIINNVEGSIKCNRFYSVKKYAKYH